MSCEFRPTDVMVTLLMLLLFGWLLVVPAASAQEAATAQESATAPEPIAGVAHGAESEDTPSVGVPADGGETTAAGPLANSSWHLVEFQSMSDEIGTVRPDVPKLYTMYLGGDGRVSMRLNCNRANGEWFAEPGVDGLRGRFWFGPLAATRAHCPPPSMDESIAAHSVYVRSYVFEDGKLYTFDHGKRKRIWLYAVVAHDEPKLNIELPVAAP